ncbi:Aspartyl protease family protein [Camellia lanceoleosa]|uniref:Aspartyl protease family protein n=1 Tax=Camellia lanceoleosa TaxID=1840588 RepID=A0ACC0FMQ2_9ERIC|nr:Aspartyl protease family protein [Camellia lanceoleosa]
MATSIPSISIIFFLFASYQLVSLFLLFSLEKGYALHDEKTLQNDYHTIRISSLLPASVCNSSTNGHTKKATLKVVHKHGPCSHLSLDKANVPNVTQILSEDQSRVNLIHFRLSSNSAQNNILKSSKATLPVNSGASIGTGNFVVTVGLGTPKKDLTLVFDTGSDLTWTQCQPCLGSCYQQQEPIFNPNESTTYKNISCNSAECTQLTSNAGGVIKRCSNSSICIYGVGYVDQSYSIGFFSKDTLTLTPTDVLPNFRFGCGQSNDGLFGGAAGLLGLGRNQLSVVSQTSSMYQKYFSYCLPSASSSTGHLTFGKGGPSSALKLNFTPFSRNSKNPSFYFVHITGIKVGGRKLSIAKSVFKTTTSIIDSGTVITRLPPAIYSALRTAFRRKMTNYLMTKGLPLLDTCYDLSNNKTVLIPKISFYFQGNVEAPIYPTGILFGHSVSQVCLAFAGNSNASDVGIFGNNQQKTLEVAYDVTGGKLGFGTGGCS